MSNIAHLEEQKNSILRKYTQAQYALEKHPALHTTTRYAQQVAG
ncbi:hypothetical protein [Helicobacter sp. L8]|nr:hypothetical protein [Helicobacter sp. L8]